MQALKIATTLESKYRRLRRLVDNPLFKNTYKKYEDKEYVDNLVSRCKINILKDWLYRNSPLVDAPIRWLRKEASIYKIKDYSRKGKVEIVDELVRIYKQSAK